MADLGKIFRLLTSIRWKTEDLPYPWVEDAMSELRCFQGDLSEARKVFSKPDA
jgi:hypothetical protein